MNGIIINDPGGSILGHIAYGSYLADIGANLKVIYCVSACLNLLAQVPQDRICFTPAAWVGYHTDKQNLDGTEKTTTMRWERGRDWIDRGYKECERWR